VPHWPPCGDTKTPHAHVSQTRSGDTSVNGPAFVGIKLIYSHTHARACVLEFTRVFTYTHTRAHTHSCTHMGCTTQAHLGGAYEAKGSSGSTEAPIIADASVPGGTMGGPPCAGYCTPPYGTGAGTMGVYTPPAGVAPPSPARAHIRTITHRGVESAARRSMPHQGAGEHYTHANTSPADIERYREYANAAPTALATISSIEKKMSQPRLLTTVPASLRGMRKNVQVRASLHQMHVCAQGHVVVLLAITAACPAPYVCKRARQRATLPCVCMNVQQASTLIAARTHTHTLTHTHTPFHRMLPWVVEHQECTGGAKEHQGAPRSTKERQGAPRSTKERQRAPRSTKEHLP